MKYVSTRNRDVQAGLSQAIVDGIAPDGGLYVPESVPTLSPGAFPRGETLDRVACELMRGFVSGDALERHLDAMCRQAFNFPAPLVRLSGTPGPASALELFHGPTSAFKDFGARFLAASFERIERGDRKLTVLVATSGDTGAAVAASLHNVPWADVVLLYPKGLVSPRQAQQLGCWGGNVRTFAVLGTFDDCQRLVKEAFQDPALSRAFVLSSANSINIGRFLPQIAYYAYASLQIWNREGCTPNFIVPSGNLGNAAACVVGREMGLPIGRIVLATNQNRTIADYLEGGTWRPRRAVPTLASAMDVGSPSNIERLRWLWPGENDLRQRITAYSVSDEEIRAVIRQDFDATGHVWCPHTATAAHVYRKLVAAGTNEHWVIVATAHPAKFSEVIEPLIDTEVPVPAALQRLLRLNRHETDLAPTAAALREQLTSAS